MFRIIWLPYKSITHKPIAISLITSTKTVIMCVLSWDKSKLQNFFFLEDNRKSNPYFDIECSRRFSISAWMQSFVTKIAFCIVENNCKNNAHYEMLNLILMFVFHLFSWLVKHDKQTYKRNKTFCQFIETLSFEFQFFFYLDQAKQKCIHTMRRSVSTLLSSRRVSHR